MVGEPDSYKVSKKMTKKITIGLISIFSLVLLTACQAGSRMATTRAGLTQAVIPQVTLAATDTPVPTPEQSATITPTAAPTQDLAIAAAEQTVQDYFTALENGDYAAASKQVSDFSLMINYMTAGDVASALTQQSLDGAAWSELQIEDSQVFDEKTVLVHVTYQLTAKDSKTGKVSQSEQDELWPVRLENGNWLYNWTNVIDFKTLGLDYQQTAGLTIAPLQLTRYTDKLRLTVLAQNSTNDPIVIGQTNQILATFHFGDQTVEATNTRYTFYPQRSYDNVAIDVPGLFTSYPDSVDIVKYKDYNVAPWFSFNLGS